MKRSTTAPHRRPAQATGVILAALSLLLGACGGGGSSSGTTGAASTTPATGTSTSAKKSAGPVVKGRWRGEYSGEYKGTFALTLTETETDPKGDVTLKGEITLTTPPLSAAINGQLRKGRIALGTFGTPAIEYNANVSGVTMTGDYQTVHGGGNFKATKIE